MNLIELTRALKQLRLGGMAAVLETRLRQAQSEPLAPIDLISCLVSDELARRGERLLDFDRDHLAWPIEGGNHDRYDAASCAKLEHPVASTRARKATEQNRLDRKAIAVPWLDQRDRTVQDRVASFVG